MTIHLTWRTASGGDDRALADRFVSDILAAGGRPESLTAEVLVLMLWTAGHRTDVEARARRVADIIGHGAATTAG